MLIPKRVKHRKQFRGRLKGKAQRGNKVAHGDFGLVALEPAWITNRQIEASRIAMTRYIKRGVIAGSSPAWPTIQFVLEPDSLRKRVRVRFLFIGGSAEGLLGTVNEQRQGITMIVVSCLLLCGIKFALCELGRPPIWRVWE